MSEVKRYIVATLPGRMTRDCVEVVKARDYDALKAENARLREALLKYGVHDPQCPSWGDPMPYVCNCGLHAALKEGVYQVTAGAVDAARAALESRAAEHESLEIAQRDNLKTEPAQETRPSCFGTGDVPVYRPSSLDAG